MQELLGAKWGDEFAEGLAYCSQMEMVRGVEVVDNEFVSFSWKAEHGAFGHFDRIESRVLKGNRPGHRRTRGRTGTQQKVRGRTITSEQRLLLFH